MLDQLKNLIAMLRDVHAQVATIHARGVAQEREIEALRQRLDSLHLASEHASAKLDAAASKQNAIETQTFENGNRVLSALSALDTQTFENSNRILSAFNDLNNVTLPDLGGELHEVAAIVLKAGAHADGTAPATESKRPAPDLSLTFEVALARGARDHASVFDHWKTRLDDTAAAFAETKVGNAAHLGDVYSRLFRLFVERHAAGAILDVGCGPFGVPYYLEGFARDRISGLEPLPAPPADFTLVRGISEYLPWPDASFDTIVSATSLDHCLSLDRTLDEFERVLAPGGSILLWIGSNPGAAEFRPEDPAFEPADQYHLFHFDTAWFEPMLERRFVIGETQKFRRPGYAHVFYRLTRLDAARN